VKERPRRPRRIVSPRTVRILRALGYRYSRHCEAWVHRLGGRRFGPVFVDLADDRVADMSPEMIAQLLDRINEPDRIQIAPVDERPPLPKRATGGHHERLTPVQWLHDEEHKLVYVDGRPPMVGRTPPPHPGEATPAASIDRPTVVPLKRTRATG